MARASNPSELERSALNSRATNDSQIYDYPPDLDFETMQELFRRDRKPLPADSPGYAPRGKRYADNSGMTITDASGREIPQALPGDELPGLWRDVLDYGAGQSIATPSNASAKRDAGDFGQGTPPIWEALMKYGVDPGPSEEEKYLQGLNPLDALKMSAELGANQRVSDGQKDINGRQNVHDLMSIIPGVGNIVSGIDAYKSFDDMAGKLGEGNTGQAAISGGAGALGILGALTGLPFSKAAGQAAKGASSRTNIFMGASPDLDRGFDRAMRISEDMSGAPLGQRNASIFPETGLFMAPEGILKKEVSDFNTLPSPALTGNSSGPATLKAGDELAMGELMPHPAYARDPSLAEMHVRMNDAIDSRGRPISRTDPATGIFEMSAANKGPRAQILKALQYEIQGKDPRFAAGARHGAGVNEAELAHITGRLDEAARRALDGGNPALAAKLGPYRQMLADTGDEVASARSMIGKPLGDPDFVSDMVKAGRAYRAKRMGAANAGDDPAGIALDSSQISNSINDFLYSRSAGQQEKTLAQARVGIRPDQAGRADPLSSWWQYKKEVPPNFEKFTYGDPDSLIALPRSNLTDDEMIDFALNWAKHGAGSGR